MRQTIRRSLLFILSYIQLFVFSQIPINAQGITYYDVINSIIEKDGIYQYDIDTGLWTGLIYGELIDFDEDNNKEMLLVYNSSDDIWNPDDILHSAGKVAVYKNVNETVEKVYEEKIGSSLGQTDDGYCITLKYYDNKMHLLFDRYHFEVYEDMDIETISSFTMNNGKAEVIDYYAEVGPWWYNYEFNYHYCQANGKELDTDEYLDIINRYENSKTIYFPEVSNDILEKFINEVRAEGGNNVSVPVANNQFPTLNTVCNLYYNVICNNNSMFSEYSIYDIDKDGIPELLLKTGDCEANYEYDVYTINHNSLKSVGIFNGFHTCLFSYPGSGILREVGHMGYERVSLVNYIYGQFFEELKYEADDSYDPDTCDYYYSANMDKYFEGAKPIKHIFEDKSYGTLYSEAEKYLAQETGIKVSLNGNELTFDQNPVLLNSRTMVPLRVIFESLGASVEWNQDEKSVTSKKDGTTIKIKVNSNKMSVNDKTIELDAAPIIINGRTLVPVRAISESFGCNVEWNGETRSVKIIMNIAEAPTNPYNQMGYINITGKTLGDIAKENHMELSALLEEYDLPKDMAGDTEESAAYYCMPAKRVAQMYEMSFAEMKELLDFGDDITEDTPWGYAEGETTLGIYVGIDMFKDFKKEYGLGDDITISTKWKEVRNIVDLETKRRFQEDQYIKESRPYTQKTLK